jgi:hypothetical protein
MQPSTRQILDRLEVLHRKLEADGAYVASNTVWLAIEEIKRLSQAAPPRLTTRETP